MYSAWKNFVVIVGSQTKQVPFVVVTQLVTDASLGCSYIDKVIEDIICQKRSVLLKNGDFILIIRLHVAAPVPHLLSESELLCS